MKIGRQIIYSIAVVIYLGMFAISSAQAVTGPGGNNSFPPPLAAAADNNSTNNNNNNSSGNSWDWQNWFNKFKQNLQSQTWQNMLDNMAKSFPNIEAMLKGFAYLTGLVFAVRSLYYFKVYGELRTMMASNSSLKPPLTYLTVAIVFIYLPTTIDILMNTMFGSPDIQPLSYISATESKSYGRGLRAILAFIQLIGYIAFIRGWLIISHTAQQGAGRDTFGKGLTHIIGGLLAINIVSTRDVIWNTLGLS